MVITKRMVDNAIKKIVRMYEFEGINLSKNVFSRFKNGRICKLSHPNVGSMCMLGAILRVVDEKHMSRLNALELRNKIVHRVHRVLPSRATSIMEFNDAHHTRRKDVLERFRACLNEEVES